MDSTDHTLIYAQRCDLTEAEASIIAFALNAVAEGGTLESVVPTGERIDGGVADGARIFDCRKYDGPTEGVAP